MDGTPNTVSYAFDTADPSLKVLPPFTFRVRIVERGIDREIPVRFYGSFSVKPAAGSAAAADGIVLKKEFVSSLRSALSSYEDSYRMPEDLFADMQVLSARAGELLKKRWPQFYGVSFDGADELKGEVLPEGRAVLDDIDGVLRQYDAVAASMASGGVELNSELISLYNAGNKVFAAEEKQGWYCICGTLNNGNFCTSCGSMRPWKCLCGAINTTRFCPLCGRQSG